MSRQQLIEEAAARWIMRRGEPDWSEESQLLLDDWLAQSYAHKAALWRLEHCDARTSLLAGADQAHDFAHEGGPRWDGGPPHWHLGSAAIRAMRNAVVPMCAAASLILVLLVGLPRYERIASPIEASDHSTPIGQISNIKLADGTSIDLNTDSQVRISQSDAKRDVQLVRGEAYFSVAHDPSRPFRIRAGNSLVTVLGTKFMLRREGQTLTVGVVEGKVRLAAVGQGDSGETFLTRGALAVSDGRSTLVTKGRLNTIEASLAWRSGMIMFENSSLANAVEQFNRYNQRKIVLTDSSVEELRIGGSFRCGNIEGFARLLSSAYGLKVTYGDEIKISRR